MTWSDQFIEHARAAYDPKARRERYLRTRKLKGRKKGQEKPTGQSSKGKKQSTSVTVRLGPGYTVKLTAKQHAEQTANAKKEVARIRHRLADLNKKLKERMAEARATDRKAQKPATAAEKRKAAKESRQYRAKNQQSIKTANRAAAAKEKRAPTATKPKTESVDSLRTQIRTVQSKLDEVISRQKALASATRNG